MTSRSHVGDGQETNGAIQDRPAEFNRASEDAGFRAHSNPRFRHRSVEGVWNAPEAGILRPDTAGDGATAVG